MLFGFKSLSSSPLYVTGVEETFSSLYGSRNLLPHLTGWNEIRISIL